MHWSARVWLGVVHICTRKDETSLINLERICKTGSCPYLYNKLCQTKEGKCCQDSCMKRTTKF